MTMEERKELTIEEIHEGTIGILKKIIELCDMLQVNYYIMYGSLIGAVRHHGFIPWDDDLDIAMLRPEYEKLCSYCETHQGELGHFALMNRRTAKEYPYNISRFGDMRCSEEKQDTLPGAGMGVQQRPVAGKAQQTAGNPETAVLAVCQGARGTVFSG